MSLSKSHFPQWRVHCHLDHLKEGRKVVKEACLKEDQFLYHFLPWSFAERIFEKGCLRLSLVRSWSDPYEKAWCRLLFEGDGQLFGVNAYGLCWTTSRYDEPSWRMAAFRRCSPIVRIRCRVGPVLEAGRNLIAAEAGSLFLGKVRYVRQKALHTLAQTVKDKEHKEVSYTAAALLLQKRNAFRFEKEVRLMWFDRAEPREYLDLPISTHAVINQVMTSPYSSEEEHEFICSRLQPYGIKPKKSGILWETEF